MERMKASAIPQEVINLYNRYLHGAISRRQFFDGAAKFTAGGLTVAAMFEALRPNYALGQQIAKTDSRIKAEYLSYASPQGNSTTKGYFVRPATASAKLPGVLVVHENRGLNPHIEDVARRLAIANFVVFAPDALAPLGGYPGEEEKAGQLFGQLDGGKRTEDFVAATNWLKARPECTGRVGAVGFCFGGGVVNMLATRVPDLAAAVPFYGTAAPAADVPKINAALLIHYAGLDTRINAGWPAFETALKAAGKNYTMHMYEGANHGFNNDTGARYDKTAADLAWQRTIAHFNRYLRS
jgi:carboxymethylenebutenolidase